MFECSLHKGVWTRPLRPWSSHTGCWLSKCETKVSRLPAAEEITLVYCIYNLFMLLYSALFQKPDVPNWPCEPSAKSLSGIEMLASTYTPSHTHTQTPEQPQLAKRFTIFHPRYQSYITPLWLMKTHILFCPTWHRADQPTSQRSWKSPEPLLTSADGHPLLQDADV